MRKQESVKRQEKEAETKCEKQSQQHFRDESGRERKYKKEKMEQAEVEIHHVLLLLVAPPLALRF